jgi:DNA repair ATPase RecN
VTSDLVNASPEDVRRLASALRSYQEQVSTASRSVQKALASANWHDGQKQRFECRYSDLQKSIDRFMTNEVSSMIKTLNQLARKLDDIKGMRM